MFALRLNYRQVCSHKRLITYYKYTMCQGAVKFQLNSRRMTMILGYWNIRARAQPVRLFLEYLGESYQEKLYPVTSRADWFNVKFKLGFDFPNLPYLIDGKVKLSQTMAILRYIADKHNMLGSTIEQRAQIYMLEGTVGDLREKFRTHCRDLCQKDKKDEFAAEVLQRFEQVNIYLKDRRFLTGEKPNYVDFVLYEALDVHLYYLPNCLDKFVELRRFHQSIEQLPAIASFLASPRFIEWPLFGPYGHFGCVGTELVKKKKKRLCCSADI